MFQSAALECRQRVHGGKVAALGHLGDKWQQGGFVFLFVHLVDHQHHRQARIMQGVIGQTVFVVPATRFDHQQGHIHPFQGTARSAIHHPVHRLAGALALLAMDARGVHQLQLPAWKRGNPQQPMPRGLRPVGGDADLGTHQRVDQGGFADVGAADHGHCAAA